MTDSSRSTALSAAPASLRERADEPVRHERDDAKAQPGAKRATRWTSQPKSAGQRKKRAPTYAALDLGTNNCRLLIARPTENGFRVLDGFSRIVRLGEGLSQTGRLSDAAMERTIEALKVCKNKLAQHDGVRARIIATEACRSATNSAAFLARVKREVGLTFEVVDRKTEAELAVTGCADLVETDAPYLAPPPHRGKTNEPAFTAHTARRAAETFGLDYADFAARTQANFDRLFSKAAQFEKAA